MKNIDNYDFTGKKAIVRVDFNVPLNEKFEVTDSTRIKAAIPTIKKIAETGSVILMSHFGRPKGQEEKYSLKHIISAVNELLGKDVIFIDDCIGEKVENICSTLNKGEVVLLENLRFYSEEEKGDKVFAEKLSKLADVYVNDAFGTAHRAHASTAVIADFFPTEKLFGYLMQDEVNSLEKVLKFPQKPFTAILGGAKVSTKIPVIEQMLSKVDNLIIGGGMMFTFIKAQGGNVGSSMVEDDFLETAKSLLETAKKNNVNIYLPVDSVNADKFSNDANISMSNSNSIPSGEMGLDIGKESIKTFCEVIENSKTILWNGPMGVFEMDNFAKGTISVAESLVRATEKGAFTLVGGGDSVAAINKYNLEEKVSYVSTGGGAMLEFMEGKDLPGVKAIRG
jgi:phosphoglycerate kinase